MTAIVFLKIDTSTPILHYLLTYTKDRCQCAILGMSVLDRLAEQVERYEYLQCYRLGPSLGDMAVSIPERSVEEMGELVRECVAMAPLVHTRTDHYEGLSARTNGHAVGSLERILLDTNTMVSCDREKGWGVHCEV